MTKAGQEISREPLLEARGIFKYFGAVTALRDVDLVITQPTPDICGVVISGRCWKKLDHCRGGMSQAFHDPPDLRGLSEARKDALIRDLQAMVQEREPVDSFVARAPPVWEFCNRIGR